MIRQLIFVSLLLTTLRQQYVFGQDHKSDEEYKKYSKSLRRSKVDTILVIRSGCTGCEVNYQNEPRSVIDDQNIYVLFQKDGQFKLAIFDDIHNPIYFTSDTCSVFETIDQKKSILKLKDDFYEKELADLKKSKFFPPRPIHYPFEELKIQLPGFQYEFLVTGKVADYLGFVRENEIWFKATNSIIEKVFAFSTSLKD